MFQAKTPDILKLHQFRGNSCSLPPIYRMPFENLHPVWCFFTKVLRVVWCQCWEPCQPPPPPPQHLWTCEAVPFSEAYNSTLCAAVCKNSIVWPLCSTQWTGHWCCMSKTARRREHSTHKEFCMLTCSMIHIFLWFIHRWACRKRHASVANV